MRHYLNVYSGPKSEKTSGLVYTLSAEKGRNLQIQNATFHRMSEYTEPVAYIDICIVPPFQRGPQAAMKGRPLAFTFQFSNRVISDKPDRFGKQRDWCPRRFEYGARKFVWRDEKTSVLGVNCPNTLYEVEKQWSVEGSKTGKVEETVFGTRLCWGEKFHEGVTKGWKICFAGGLDQGFVEFLLANQLTRLLVIDYGSD